MVESDYSHWVGKRETLEDELGLSAARLASVVFEHNPSVIENGGHLPWLWHWFYFLPQVSQRDLGEDGHPRRNEQSFLPPLPFRRRMFAGASLECHKPLRVGLPAIRESEITQIQPKSGRSGEMVFVTVEHRILQSDQLCLTETQNLVYRQPDSPLEVPELKDFASLPPETVSKTVTPDTRLLFRYSALTFNAHRIHYDRNYAQSEEGYPGLIVHGQLIATLLIAMAEELVGEITRFEFRSTAPLFDLAPFRLSARLDGTKVSLEAQRSDGVTAMKATAVSGKK